MSRLMVNAIVCIALITFFSLFISWVVESTGNKTAEKIEWWSYEMKEREERGCTITKLVKWERRQYPYKVEYKCGDAVEILL